MKEIIIFGAGGDGKKALNEIGKDYVICFIDNNPEKWGRYLEGKKIINIDEYLSKYNGVEVVIATRAFHEIARQLDSLYIKYQVWIPTYNWFGDEENLIVNPYLKRKMQLSQEDVNTEISESEKDFLNNCTEIMFKQNPLFNHIEIETYNRCNGGCEFCPVSVINEQREERKMSTALFMKIIDELETMDYHGCLALFSNNEPFLDDRMTEFCRVAKGKLPHAKMHLYSNGTVLTLERFVEVIEYLDELIIDNYNVDLELINTNKKIAHYCKGNPELEKKVTIVYRNPKEVLEARGGYAPNKIKEATHTSIKCTHPFRQLIIRPDGKVSICCNDALGVTEMGDVSKNSLVEVWYGKKFMSVREKINQFGRGGVDFCRYCDSMRLV